MGIFCQSYKLRARIEWTIYGLRGWLSRAKSKTNSQQATRIATEVCVPKSMFGTDGTTDGVRYARIFGDHLLLLFSA